MTKWLVVVVTCAALFSSVVDMFNFDYCCLDCIPTSHTHIACRTESSPPPPECKPFARELGPSYEGNSTDNVTVASASPDVNHNDTAGYYRFKRQSIPVDVIKNRVDGNDVLDAVNEIRRNWVINVNASNMEEVAYDEEVGDLAAIVAQTCNSMHHYCADTPAFEVKILKYNVTVKEEYKLNVTNVMGLWTKGRNELLKRAETDNIYRQSDEKSGDFITLVRATTSRMGCADAINTMVDPDTNKTDMTYQITCLFGPYENKIGEPMWVQGEPCATCPPGTSCGPYGLLCTRAEQETLPLDANRTSRCYLDGDDYLNHIEDERLSQELGRFRDFNTGIKVVLKPRRICDPIDFSTGTRVICHLSTVAASFLLAHSDWIKLISKQ